MNFVELQYDEAEDAVAVINAAAQCYTRFLPPEEWQPPEMTPAQWREEAQRMRWFGVRLENTLCAVMGLEPCLDAALIRHAYVAPDRQRAGFGSALLRHVEAFAAAPARWLIAGTYARNLSARALFERHGYVLSPDSEPVLRRYYRIPETRLRTSVTLVKAL